MDKPIVLIGYSGHSFEIIESLKRKERGLYGYCEKQKKDNNPYFLNYLGNESDEAVLEVLRNYEAIVTIGENQIRQKAQEFLEKKGIEVSTLMDLKSLVSGSVSIGKGSVILKGCSINAQTTIGEGVICNTNTTIEHECQIEDYVHIAPGATICGNVKIGKGSLIGAGAVILPNIEIGENVIIGANSMVNKNIPKMATAFGNPARIISENA